MIKQLLNVVLKPRITKNANTLSNIIATDNQSKESAFYSCFFQALWRAVRVVCGLESQPGGGCTAP